MYHIFLDDLRQPHNVTWVKLPQVHWTIARSFKDFVELVQNKGLPEIITFDHDLSDEHYQEYEWAHDEKNPKKGTFRYHKMEEKTGFHCAKWLIEYCMARNLDLPKYYVHTMNPIGAVNIVSIFESYKKSQNID